MATRRYTADPRIAVRAALAIGPLTPERGALRFGRRLFSHQTANILIAAGEAVRRADGSVVACVPQT